ncbi:MAG: serine hydrolase [Proteobacteria bacterium]|nr:serine hydrolase [Pseudomonadota bacterium]
MNSSNRARSRQTAPASRCFAFLAAALVVLTHSVAVQAADAPPVFASAADTDPVTLGWMAGYPPPLDKQIRYDDGSHYRFPQWRWSFSHWREVMPSAEVLRGTGPVTPLVRAERDDLDAVTFTPPGGSTPLTWADSLATNYTDGIVVLHRGRMVYERYFGALSAERSHIAFSVTKSVIGTLAAMLVAEGKLDAAAPVSRYLPELAAGGFGDATVGQVLDMTTALDFSENYVGGSDSFLSFARAAGMFPRPAGYTGPSSILQFLPTVARKGNHGEAFTYRSPNTEVLGWLIARVTGKRPELVLQERIWSRLGAESDAFIALDPSGAAVASGGFNCRLRDLARFGEMIRLQGRYNGQQIVPAAVIADIRKGGSPEAFVPAGYKTLPGWSYRKQWWISHDDHGTFMARGIHGQAIYIDPKAEMVIARFASHPRAGNMHFDPTSLPAFRAIAEQLLRKPR